ncbi:MAG: N-acetylmuramoyl-L-alanine amidase [Verrucomicrobiota bacterium]
MQWSRAVVLMGLVCLFGVTSAVGASLDKVKKYGRTYFTLDSMCRYYDYKRAKTIPGKDPIFLEGRYGKIELRLNNRMARINGVKAWLSFPVINDSKKGILVSEIDVKKLIDPIVRPEEMVPRRKVKGIVIDPGHGGADRGARSRAGYTEKRANLITANYLKKMFEDDGLQVVMTRKKDVFLSLWQRARIANRYKGHLFISIHYNSSTVRSSNGIETYSMTPRGAGSTSSGTRVRKSDHQSYDGNKHDLHNTVLMDLVHRELMTMHTEKGDRGLKRARFVVLREVAIPAVLVEGGFLSHSVDARLIKSDSYKKKVAKAVHRAVSDYIEIMDSPKVAALARLQEPAVAKKEEEQPKAKEEKASETELAKSQKSEPPSVKAEGEEPKVADTTEQEPDKPKLPMPVITKVPNVPKDPIRGPVISTNPDGKKVETSNLSPIELKEMKIIERLKAALETVRGDDEESEATEQEQPKDPDA